MISIYFSVLFTFLSLAYTSVFSQQHTHGETCGHPDFPVHRGSVYQKIGNLEKNPQFLNRFESKYQFGYASFIDVNRYFISLFRQEIANLTFGETTIPLGRIENLLFELVDEAANRGDLWFEIPADHGVDKIYYGKHGFNPVSKKDNDDGIPKTLACLNADFEDGTWNGWETICATAMNTALTVTDLQPYDPLVGECTSPSDSPQQHSLWTGGADPIGGFPRVFGGIGVSAMIGNGPQANNPQRQAAVLRKTFVVDASNPIITYSYAAVLQDQGHTPDQQPFFNVMVTVDGDPYPCANYSAIAGDGQSGWVYVGNYSQGTPNVFGASVYARDWTTIAVPLYNYIGSTVVLEFSVSDCSLNGGTHFAYAYVDASCGNMEIESFCQNNSTILSAPSDGIAAYLWNTGETTQQIVITDPGEYSVIVQPYGSPCSTELTYDAIIHPLPAAEISGTTTVCQYASEPQVTFIGNDGTPDYEFTYSINGGAHQTVTTSESSSVTVNVPTGEATVYHYILHSVKDTTTGCYQAQADTVTVTVNPIPDAAIAGSVTVCQGDTAAVVSFTGQNSSDGYVFSYTVNNGPDQVVMTAGSDTTVPQSTSTPGTYVYELVNVINPVTLCKRDTSLTATIVVRPLPVADISASVKACYFDTILPEVIFTGTGGEEPYTFTYNINGGTAQYAASTGSAATFQVPTNEIGSFIYTITHIEDGSIQECGQHQNVSTMVTIHDLPVVSAGNNFSSCAGVQVVLTGSGAQTYTWDNSIVNGVPFIPSDTTIYTVTGTDHNGCQNTGQVTVSVVPVPVMDFEGVNLSGCSPVTPTFTNHSTGNLTNCTWYLGNGEVLQGCGTVSAVFNDPGCFDVTLVVSTPEGCTNTLTKNNYVCVDARPIADFYPKPSELTTYEWESQMVNQSIGATSFEWDFGDGSAPSYEYSPSHEYPNETAGMYTVTLVATSSNGCLDTAYAVVTVKENLLLYVPNTFTPDNDNYNEIFKPVLAAGYDPGHYTLHIYNRWGEIVFESHDANVGWSGRYGVNGKVCQDGTYIWKIRVKKRWVDEHKEVLGHVNLIR